MTAAEMLVLEKRIRDKHMEEARKELERELQKAASAIEPRDRHGAKLTHREREMLANGK